MQIRSVGIDLGKTTFHLVALGDSGKVLLKKKFTQKQLITFTANMQTTLIGLEACSGAHFLGRALREQGHDVKLIPAQFVRPFVKSNKNDFLDAEAIAEAVDRQNMRFVPIKTDDQLDLQALHRVRDRLSVVQLHCPLQVEFLKRAILEFMKSDYVKLLSRISPSAYVRICRLCSVFPASSILWIADVRVSTVRRPRCLI